jgi:hypothetical protein
LTENPSIQSQLKSFGVIVGGIFLFIGVWPLLVKNQDIRWWSLAIGTLFVLLAMTASSILRPIHQAWMFIGHILGWVNTKVILTVGFFLIVMPIGLAMRVFGRDPMRRRYVAGVGTYRVPRTYRSSVHMKQQY